MKNLWMLAVLLSLSIGVKANHYGSSIVIKSTGNAPILVKLDGRRSPQLKPAHKFNDIRPGRHFVEVYRTSQNQPHWGHQPPRLVYRGYVRADKGFKTVYVLNRGSLRIASKKHLPHNGHGNGYYNGHEGYGNGHSPHCPGNCNGACSQPYGGYLDQWGDEYGGQPWGGNTGYYGGHQPIGYPDFWSFMNRMRRNITDARKVEIAKRELKDVWLTTEQVNIVLDDLFFEQQKLDLAKDLYHRTVDPEKYMDLDEQFEFSSNRKKLSEYVERNAAR